MKCHFSACGHFLHIAALEGRHESVPKRRRDKGRVDPMMKLAILVSTHRLCNKETCRSPPSLIYHTRVELASVSSLTVSNLPFTLTWTPRELYFTRRDVTLQVYRILLFNSKSVAVGSKFPVMKPQGVILLPDTALERNVYYFPPTNTSSVARVIVGSHLLPPSPPVCCLLHEQNDLGGWIQISDNVDIPGDRGVAQLGRPLEKFDPEEDCDCEC